MFRKYTLLAALFFLALIILVLNAPSDSVQAQEQATLTPLVEDTFDVYIEISGVIKSITVQSSSVSIINLEDGIRILVNPATVVNTTFAVGQAITCWVVPADGDDDGPHFVAKVIFPFTPTLTPDLTFTPTLTPEWTPTATATAEPTIEGTLTATYVSCGSGNTHPVAARLADAFGVPYAEIMEWHCKGFGFGEIARAYLLAEKGEGLTVTAIFAMRSAGQGWGSIVKDSGVAPSELAPGKAVKGQGKPDKDKGNDKEKGNNKDKDKDKGKGK